LKTGIADQREIHHFAVDLFYKTYFPDETGRGRPRLADEDMSEAKQLHDSGHSWSEVKAKLGSADDTSGKFRKRASRKRTTPESAERP
jgi:hypothetical protein